MLLMLFVRSSKRVLINLNNEAKGLLARIMRSRPERNRSVWNRYAECSYSLGMFNPSTLFEIALISFRWVV